MVLSMLSVWSPKASATNLKSSEKGDNEPIKVTVDPVKGHSDKENIGTKDIGAKDNVDAVGSSSPVGAEESPKPPVDSTAASDESNPTASGPSAGTGSAASKDRPELAQPRFSFRSLGLFYGTKNTVTHEQDANEREKVYEAAKRESLSMYSRSADRRAQRNALVVQKLIVGPVANASADTKAHPVSRAQLTTIKSELMKPKSANRLIAKLRTLPTPDGPSKGEGTESPAVPAAKEGVPIHAVCLEDTEADVQTKHFSKLEEASVVSASIEAITSLFNELHIVDLLAAPDFGLGQPGDGEGILAGAVPTAETIIEGAAKLTPQLMALGYATGKAVLPDHTGVHPPTDRMSVLTYWWGLELCLPPPSLAHLAQAPSITHELINFLTALSLMNDGVREVLPFVRYIGQFVDFEWSAIKKQDKGRGVVCAATWIMPAAMVPRPWDFLDAPPPSEADITGPSDKPDAAETPHTGEVVEDIVPTPIEPVPTLLVTPPSVIKNSPAQETPEP